MKARLGLVIWNIGFRLIQIDVVRGNALCRIGVNMGATAEEGER